jgi:hypothetical protein
MLSYPICNFSFRAIRLKKKREEEEEKKKINGQESKNQKPKKCTGQDLIHQDIKLVGKK